MYVTLPQALTILEHFEFGRYGTVEVGTTRQVTPTAIVEPGEEAIALAERAGIGADHRRRREFARRTPTRCSTRTVTASAWRTIFGREIS